MSINYVQFFYYDVIGLKSVSDAPVRKILLSNPNKVFKDCKY